MTIDIRTDLGALLYRIDTPTPSYDKAPGPVTYSYRLLGHKLPKGAKPLALVTSSGTVHCALEADLTTQTARRTLLRALIAVGAGHLVLPELVTACRHLSPVLDNLVDFLEVGAFAGDGELATAVELRLMGLGEFAAEQVFRRDILSNGMLGELVCALPGGLAGLADRHGESYQLSTWKFAAAKLDNRTVPADLIEDDPRTPAVCA